MTYATPFTAAAVAWVVGAGKRPRRLTRCVSGSNAYTARDASPLSSEPPATTTRPPAPVTAAYRTDDGRCPTTRARVPGRQATIVSSHLDPVKPPTTYTVPPTTPAA